MTTSSSSLNRIEEQQTNNSKDDSIHYLLVNMDKAMSPIHLDDLKETDFFNQTAPLPLEKKEHEYNSHVYIVSSITDNTQPNVTLTGGTLTNGNADLMFN